LVDIMATRTAVMPAVPPTYPAFQFQNGNQLLDRYPGALAGKTGFTDAARHTYVGAAERDGRTLVAALMQGEQQPVPMWEQAAALLDWGFALPDGTPPVGELVDPLAPGQALPTPATAAPIDSATTTPREAPLAAATSPTERHSRFLLAVGLGVGSALLVLAIGFRLRRG
jgi:D-alanyl-D-alanine carboxypeptidase (penicillin-binding protein 5/6)